VDRQEATIADRVRLVLEATADETHEVQLPAFTDKLDQFAVADYRSPPLQLLHGGKVLHRRSYVLEPFLSGEYRIPAMTVTFWNKGEKEPKRHTAESEEITVRVKSLLPEQAEKLDIRDIAPPVALPASRRGRLYAAVALGALATAGLVALAVRRARRRRGRPESRLSPREVAYAALEALLAQRLIEQEQVKPFYQRLSAVLRRYIEDRFGLRAPEMTTEEFLTALRSSDALGGKHKGRLAEFLRHCDLVKFAEYPPTAQEVQGTFDVCKAFIFETDAPSAASGGATA
jgi:hypothetical protein